MQAFTGLYCKCCCSDCPVRDAVSQICTVALRQGHLDMVTEKNSDVQHDFFVDGLTLQRSEDGAWLLVAPPPPFWLLRRAYKA